ncbi:MAG: glutamate racemase [Treponema sp.]|jgi:glutamate racemase|nr:glutamate racemase [Treponema sp.]
MDIRPVLFIDSGIGGIPYCMDFLKKNPHEAVYYLADNKNFPYGPREKKELTAILIELAEKLIKKIDPKIIVLACNTATIAALSALRENFPQIPFVGTVPAVKPAALACNNGKVGVLGTERTIEEIRGLNLADETCEIYGIAAPELVEFIELRFDTCKKSEKTDTVKKYIEQFRLAKVDTLVLGCTHFLFLLEEFHKEAKPCFEVFDSLAGITKRIESLLDENNRALRTEKDACPVRKFILTSNGISNGITNGISSWQNRAKKFGFNLLFLDEL